MKKKYSITIKCMFLLFGVGIIFASIYSNCCYEKLLWTPTSLTHVNVTGITIEANGDYESPIMECENVNVPLLWCNNLYHPITLKKVRTSCGCQSITQINGSQFSVPLSLPPRSSLPFFLNIDTCAMSGIHVFSVAFDIESEDNYQVVSYKSEINVIPGLRSSLDSVCLPAGRENKESVSFFLSDGLPDPGIEIASVTSSHPNMIHVAIKNIETIMDRRSSEKGNTKSRYAVTVAAEKVVNSFQGSITVTPKNCNCKAIVIPVFVLGSSSQ